jgi:hypothetical protein
MSERTRGFESHSRRSTLVVIKTTILLKNHLIRILSFELYVNHITLNITDLSPYLANQSPLVLPINLARQTPSNFSSNLRRTVLDNPMRKGWTRVDFVRLWWNPVDPRWNLLVSNSNLVQQFVQANCIHNS